MKEFIKYAAVTLLTIVLFALGFIAYLWYTEESPTHALIDLTEKPIPGRVIRPASTHDLAYWLSASEIDAVPRIYAENLPSDFSINGNPVLFAQTLAPLILRANEEVLNDRLIIKMLARKKQLGEPWTLKEKMFFNKMVSKYDCGLFKTVDSQLQNLLDKADKVPVSLVIIQAGIQTDWGNKNMKSPFGEKMWFDSKTYADRTFNTLIEAVDSHVLSLNATIPYYKWRLARNTLRGMDYSTRGGAFAVLVGAVNPDDPMYTQKISTFYENTKLGRLDKAKFKD